MRTMAEEAKLTQRTIRLYNCFTKYITALKKGKFPVTFEMQSDYDWLYRLYTGKLTNKITQSDMIRMNDIWKKYNLIKMREK